MSLRARVVTNSFVCQYSPAYRRPFPHFPAATTVPAAGAKFSSRTMTPGSVIRIAVVGDVHDQWDAEKDARALQFLQADVVLFTGDFGNENVDLVRNISTLEMPKAAILGNHDAWHTSQFSPRKTDRVQLQLQCLKGQHVGYSRLDLSSLKLSIVGGRPFSSGGDRIFRQGLITTRYGVNDMEGSARKIYESALGAPEGHTVIVLAHNGPTGLGSNCDDICGKDWLFEGGDNGDPDLAQALYHLKRRTKISIPLVVFGHMHNKLRYGRGQRKMIILGDDTVYLNGAIVPRVRYFKEQGVSNSQGSGGGSSSWSSCEETSLEQPPTPNWSQHVFTMIEIRHQKIVKISETWVTVMEDKCETAEENALFESIQLQST